MKEIEKGGRYIAGIRWSQDWMMSVYWIVTEP